jgi:hypothetical protein
MISLSAEVVERLGYILDRVFFWWDHSDRSSCSANTGSLSCFGSLRNDLVTKSLGAYYVA